MAVAYHFTFNAQSECFYLRPVGDNNNPGWTSRVKFAFAGDRLCAAERSFERRKNCQHGAIVSRRCRCRSRRSLLCGPCVLAAAAAKKVKKVHIAGKVNAVQIGPVLPNGSFVRHSIGSPRPGAVPGPWKGSSASRTQFKPSTSKRGASSSRKGQSNYGQQASSKSLAYSFTKVASPQKKPGSYTVPSRPSSSHP